MRRFVDDEIANSVRITPEAHRAQRSWFNRLKWGLAYFFVAVADYNAPGTFDGVFAAGNPCRVIRPLTD